MTLQQTGAFGFQFMDSAQPSMVKLHGVGHEYVTEKYSWDNAGRPGGHYLFQYTLAGCGAVALDGAVRRVWPGQGFLLRLPGNSRYYLPKEQKEGWRFAWIILSGAAVDNYCGPLAGANGAVFSLDENTPAVASLLQIFRLARQGNIQDGTTAEELAFCFACRLYKSVRDESRHRSSYVEKACSMIDKEFSTLDGVGEISVRLGISGEYLSRCFTKEMGYTVMEALTKARLKCGAGLLRQTELPIARVAAESGFSSGNYFAKVFRKVFGISPKMFRQDSVRQHYIDVFM